MGTWHIYTDIHCFVDIMHIVRYSQLVRSSLHICNQESTPRLNAHRNRHFWYPGNMEFLPQLVATAMSDSMIVNIFIIAFCASFTDLESTDLSLPSTLGQEMDPMHSCYDSACLSRRACGKVRHVSTVFSVAQLPETFSFPCWDCLLSQ